MGLKFDSTVLFVDDLQKSQLFYESILQQEVKFDFGENIGYQSGLALWQTPKAHEIIFNKPVSVNKAANFELYFESDSIEEDYKKVQTAKVSMIQELHEEPWGQLTFRVYDPDSYIVEIGESIPSWILRLSKQGLSVDEIHKTTTLPLELVEKTVDEHKK